MHNPVVFHCDRELHRAGFTTLRFNFRGVGTSDGTHDIDGAPHLFPRRARAVAMAVVASAEWVMQRPATP
jgi:hypothetical protein